MTGADDVVLKEVRAMLLDAIEELDALGIKVPVSLRKAEQSLRPPPEDPTRVRPMGTS